ncbi:MAG: BrnT family toxin [Thermomicrobiales bacterium]|nr:BrnT family toxin [Thermomicrobiales bacterium]
MEFEWDPGKRHANLDKHGIDFRRAIDVFSDPEHINEDATRPEHGEIRAKL